MPRDISCYVKLLRSFSQPVFSGGRSPSSDADVGSRRRSSLSYFRLPSDGILRLSVLKLDGSSFDVRVAGTVSVRDLKNAVEDLFSELRDTDRGRERLYFLVSCLGSFLLMLQRTHANR